MTELTRQFFRDVDRAKYCVEGDEGLKILDTLNLDHPNCVASVTEVAFSGRIYYRLYVTILGFPYVCLLPDDGSLQGFEPIAHLDDIVSGRVEYKAYEVTELTGSEAEEFAGYPLPKCFTPAFMEEEVSNWREDED